MTDITDEQLSAYLDNALSAPEKTAVDNALAASSALRKELDALRRTRAIVRDMPAPRLPTGFEQRVLRAVNRPPDSTSWLSIPPALIGAAAAAVVMVLVVTEEGGLHFAAQARRAGWVAAVPKLDDVRRNPAALLPRPAALVFTAGVSAAQDRGDATVGDASMPARRYSAKLESFTQNTGTGRPSFQRAASASRASVEMLPLAKTLLESIPGAGLIHRIQTLAPSPLPSDKTYSFAAKESAQRDLSLPLTAKVNPGLIEKSLDDQRLAGLPGPGSLSTDGPIRKQSESFQSSADNVAMAYPPRVRASASIKPTEKAFRQEAHIPLAPTAKGSLGIGAGSSFDPNKTLGGDTKFDVLADSSKNKRESLTVPRSEPKGMKEGSWSLAELKSKKAATVDPSAKAVQGEFAGPESSLTARQVSALSASQDSERSDDLSALEWAGNESGITALRETAVRSEAEWKALWSQHTSNKIGQTPAPALDFRRSMVVGIFLGDRPSSGYGVRITRIQVTKEALWVTYQETKPNPDLIQLTVMTQPFHLRTIPRSTLPVRFKKK